jgi:hypothetical protein
MIGTKKTEPRGVATPIRLLSASFHARKEGLRVDFLTKPYDLPIPRRSQGVSNPFGPGGLMRPLKSSVDISATVELAESERDAASDGEVYCELSANYAELGRLLEAWNRSELAATDAEFEDACRQHTQRSIDLGKAHEAEQSRRSAVYFHRHSGIWLGENA